MKTHIADNIYYVTPSMLRFRLGACVTGAASAVGRARGDSNQFAYDETQANINFATVRKMQAWQLTWLVSRLLSRVPGLSNTEASRAYHTEAGRTQSDRNSDKLSAAFMNLIAERARQQNKLRPCPTCGR